MSTLSNTLLIRRASEDQQDLAERAMREGREGDAEVHWYAHRTMHALSATSGETSKAEILHWRDSERLSATFHERTGDMQRALENAYTAGQLEVLVSLCK